MRLFLLSGSHTELAKEEIESLSEKASFLDGRILLVDTKKDLSKRLAYTKKIFLFLFKCKIDVLEQKIKKFDFNRYYSTSYKSYKENVSELNNNVKKKDTNFSERRLSELIWHRLNRPKINLEKPMTVFSFIFTQNNVYCGILKNIIDTSINKRKPHLRPKHMPISLDPKLARCLINLTGSWNGTIVDPFCGTGGILIESGLMKLKGKGIDNDKRMISISKENLNYYKIKDYSLINDDAIKYIKRRKKIDYIVTDLPYGKNTKSVNLENLYSRFIEILNKKLGKQAVIVFPDKVNYKNFFRTKKNKIKITKVFDYFVHRKMTKKIVVIIPKWG